MSVIEWLGVCVLAIWVIALLLTAAICVSAAKGDARRPSVKRTADTPTPAGHPPMDPFG